MLVPANILARSGSACSSFILTGEPGGSSAISVLNDESCSSSSSCCSSIFIKAFPFGSVLSSSDSSGSCDVLYCIAGAGILPMSFGFGVTGLIPIGSTVPLKGCTGPGVCADVFPVDTLPGLVHSKLNPISPDSDSSSESSCSGILSFLYFLNLLFLLFWSRAFLSTTSIFLVPNNRVSP